MHTAKTVRMLQAVAAVVGLALLLWSTGLPTFFRAAEAASVTNASDTLSNSAPSVGSNHTIQFTSPNGVSADETIEFTFPAQFTINVLDAADIDLDDGGGDETVANGANGAGQWGFATTSTTVTLTAPSDYSAASSTTFTIEIGDNATFGDTGSNQITNPSATTSYQIDIGGTMPDSGSVRVAIIDEVTVTASVDTSLEFTVSGTTTGATVNGSPTSTATNTSATALPFGTLSAGTSKVLGQDLTVVTNAANGFSVTVESTGDLQSSTGADINGFIDGADTSSPSAWQAPGGTLGSPDTYGHWAVTSTDDDFSGTADQWIAASTTPREIFAHSGPADGTSADVGRASVGFQAEITALQEAGDDYETTIRYIATPTF